MKRLERFAPWVGLTVVGLFLHGRTLLGARPYFRDTHRMFVPAKHFLWETLHNGELPQWYPFDAGGSPFIAQSQFSFFHPTTLLYAGLPFWTAFTLQDLTGTLLALFGTYVLARELGQPRLPAFLAAMTFGACGYVVCITEFTFTKLSAGGMPWYVWALFVAERKRGSWLVAPGLALALVLLGGEPQIALLTVAVGAALLLAARGVTRRTVLLAVGSPALAAGFAACQLLPSLQLVPETERGHQVSLSGLWPLTWRHLLGFSVNLRFPAGEELIESTYLGVGAVVLALLTLGQLRERRLIRALWVLTILAIWLGFGDSAGLYRLARMVVPLWDKFRFPIKLSLVVSFCGALLAGEGFARLPERLTARWGFVLVGLMAADLVLRTQPLIRTSFPDLYDEVPPLAKAMQDKGVGLRGSAFERLDETRYHPEDEAFADFAAVGGHSLSLGAYYDLPDLSFYTPGASSRVQSFLSGESVDVMTQARVYGLLGAEYLVESKELAATGAQEIVAREPLFGYALIRQKQWLPRGYAVHRAVTVSDAKAAHALIFGTSFKPGREIAIEFDQPRPDWSNRPDARAVPVAIAARTNSRVSLTATLPWPGFVVLNETMFRGWEAWVDGQSTPVLVANGFVRAIEAPAGAHTIELRYTTPGLKWGVVLSLLSLLGCGAWLVAGRRLSPASSS